MLKNTRAHYGLVAQTIHWLTAILVLFLFGLGLFMTGLEFGSEEQVATAFFWYSMHKSLGVIVLFLSILRIIWAFVNPTPGLLNADHGAEAFAAKTVHWLLYFTIIAMPLTGWLEHSGTEGFAPIWGFLPERIPFVPTTEAWVKFWANAHFLCAWFMGAAVALHIVGALKHLLIDRDDTVRRMVPFAARRDYGALEHGPYGGLSRLVAGAAVLGLAGVALSFGNPLASGDRAANEGGDTPAAETAFVPNWQVDAGQSALAINVVQNGTPTEGVFQTWQAEIQFDPNAPEQAQIRIEVDIASLDLGSLTDQALSQAYLNAAPHPVAIYRSSGFTPLSEGRYETVGTLTLAGIAQPLTLTFDLTIEDNTATANGTATILRQQHGVGDDGEIVANQVGVLFNVMANRI